VDTRHKTNDTATGNGHNRPKRFAWLPAIATVTAAVAAGNVISSATTGDAPLSWFGNTFSALLGISTGLDPRVAKVLTQMATSIDTLKLNDIKIVEALNTVMAKTIAFQKKFSSNAEAMAIMVMERDLFKTIQYVSQVLQMTVQKYVQILASASNRQTSPYALTVKEVDELSRQTLARRGFILNTNLNDIRSTAIIEENQLVLIFQIPILDESKQYHFHRAIAVPVFIGNEVHIPDIDATHIAISKSGSKYIPISVEEYT
jgi:transcriptional regulator with GAF, ATPase, and Fis domain